MPLKLVQNRKNVSRYTAAVIQKNLMEPRQTSNWQIFASYFRFRLSFRSFIPPSFSLSLNNNAPERRNSK